MTEKFQQSYTLPDLHEMVSYSIDLTPTEHVVNGEDTYRIEITFQGQTRRVLVTNDTYEAMKKEDKDTIVRRLKKYWGVRE
jgi:hypothetical protein